MPDPGYYLYQGLSSLGQNIGVAIDRRRQRAADLAAIGTAAKYFAKTQAGQKMLGTMNLLPEEFNALGPDQQGQIMQTGIALQTLQRLQEQADQSKWTFDQTQQRAADQQAANADLDQRMRAMANTDASTALQMPLVSGETPAAGEGGKLSGQAAAAIYAHHNALTPELLDRFLQRNLSDAEYQEVIPREMTTRSGKSLVYNPKAGNFQFEPEKQLDADALATLQELAPEGLTALPTGKGGVVYRRAHPLMLPNEFKTRADLLHDQWSDLQSRAAQTNEELKTLYPTLKREQLPALRKRWETDAATTKRKLQEHFDFYRARNYEPNALPGLYQQYGLEVPPDSTGAESGGAPAGAGNARRAVPDLPANRKDWIKGQTYRTNRGTLTWDGANFVP